MIQDQFTNFVLSHSEAARREALEREVHTDRFERCEILGECLPPAEPQLCEGSAPKSARSKSH